MSETLTPSVLSGPLVLRPDLHAKALDLWLLGNLGPAYIGWLPETVWAEIAETVGCREDEIGPVVRNKVQAIQLVRSPDTDIWSHEWEVFYPTVAALYSWVVDVRFLQPLDLGVLMAGVDALYELTTTEVDEEPWRFVAAHAMEFGLDYLPPPLDKANQFLRSPVDVVEQIKDRLPSFIENPSQTDTVEVQTRKLQDAILYLQRSRRDKLEHTEAVREELRRAVA